MQYSCQKISKNAHKETIHFSVNDKQVYTINKCICTYVRKLDKRSKCSHTIKCWKNITFIQFICLLFCVFLHLVLQETCLLRKLFSANITTKKHLSARNFLFSERDECENSKYLRIVHIFSCMSQIYIYIVLEYLSHTCARNISQLREEEARNLQKQNISRQIYIFSALVSSIRILLVLS